MRWSFPTTAVALLALIATGRAADPLTWHDAKALALEGQAWADTKAPYDRLPAKAEGKVRDAVWNLGRQSAGLAVRFVTDATAIDARWTLTGRNLAMPHMPATGVSGVDLYVRDDGKWKWLAVGQPTEQTNTKQLAAGIPPGKREYMLYFPLYNGVSALEVGVPNGSAISAAPKRGKPLVFWGTSITQGGCASRPGMVHTAILGRRFDSPVVNLGFSGNGKMEPEVADLLAEIDASVYVIDCLPNMTAQEVAERTGPLVQTLVKAHPKTPIVLVEDRSYANAAILPGPRERNRTSRDALRKVYDRLTADKVGGIHYLAGDSLLGDDGEATVDGSHPTDLGFVRQADAFQKVLAPLLAQPAPRAAVDGYADKLSYVPGERLRLHVSCSSPIYDVEIARVGAERVVVWAHKNFRGLEQPIPEDASSNGCRWKPSVTLEIPSDWKSGYYTARLKATDAKGKPTQSEVFFVVRSANLGRNTKILLQLCTNTYNAYCNWGGYSLYAFNGRHGVQGRRVSFDRPIRGDFARWEADFVKWAEKAGYSLDYAVNSDLEFHPEILKQYKLILSVGHDEYWSAPMRDHLEKFIAAGGNVAFFSGNTCCWQVRSEDAGQALTCWKQSYRSDPLFAGKDHSLLSTLWSHYLVNRPENMLTGVGFLHGGYHKSQGQYMTGPAAYTVHRPDHWLLEGTGLKRDDAFGGKNSIVGYECDGCELTLKDGLPAPTGRDGTPASFEVVATAPARWHPDDCEWYERWEKGREGHAVVGVYVRGGTVVTVGSTDWSHGLRGNDPTVERITRNVLDRLAR
ncbi:MAG: N,N-dimethylformamidase beta subunit family domain-containing protein [Gemmataceae bacterium]